METTTDILHKVRQIQADAQHLALNAESKPGERDRNAYPRLGKGHRGPDPDDQPEDLSNCTLRPNSWASRR